MELAGYVASILIGLILGMLGGGGSILSIPILVYLFHIDVVMASAYSLFIVGTTSLVGAITKYREHAVNVRSAVLFGIPSVVGIFGTRKWVVPSIPDVIWQTESFVLSKRLLLLGLFAVLMVLASFSMIKGTPDYNSDDERFMPVLLIIQGILIGFLTGLVGAGGGFLIVPALVLFTGLTFKAAVATSLFIIAISSLTGFIGDLMNYSMNWTFLLIITGLAVFGILLGNQFTHRISPTQLKRMFGWLILIVGCGILVRELTNV